MFWIPETRRNLELPEIDDDDLYCNEKLTVLLDEYSRHNIPGIGIRHHSTSEEHLQVHTQHKKLIANAAKLLVPRLVICNDFKSAVSRANKSRHSIMHRDILKVAPSTGSLAAKWRLHTNGNDTSVKVSLSATRGGYISPGSHGDTIIGDKDLYDTDPYRRTALAPARERGYDCQDLLPDYIALRANFLNESFDPILTENIVYQFEQSPLSSVLFCAAATLGPSTAHDFESDIPHSFYISDAIISSY